MDLALRGTTAGQLLVGVTVTGVYVLIAVLVLATAFGLWRRATDGRLKSVEPAAVTSPAVGLPVPVPDDAPPVDLHDPDAEAAAAITAQPDVEDEDRHGGDIAAADLGTALGRNATLVQFSSAFCQPCVATRRILEEVSGMVDGVVHVEVDAESHLDLVRRLDVRRTPTVFVLNATGHIVRRASGAPRKADVIAALGEII